MAGMPGQVFLWQGRRKKGGRKVCVELVSEKHKVEVGPRVRNLENELFGIQIGRSSKESWVPILILSFIIF